MNPEELSMSGLGEVPQAERVEQKLKQYPLL
jgi:hypothetical protein